MTETPGNSDPSGEDPPPNVKAQQGWQTVLSEQEATAESYRADGWDTLELHPGDAVLVDSDDRTGLDVLLPGSEYEQLEELADEIVFDAVEVFRAVEGPMVYLLIVEQATGANVAVLVPAYYDRTRSVEAIRAISTAGELRLFCRRLTDEYVEFVHDDPGPFLPADQ